MDPTSIKKQVQINPEFNVENVRPKINENQIWDPKQEKGPKTIARVVGLGEGRNFGDGVRWWDLPRLGKG